MKIETELGNVEATPEELGQVVDGAAERLGIGIQADSPVVDEQPLSEPTQEEVSTGEAMSAETGTDMVGEPSSPEATLSSSLVRKFMKSIGQHSVEATDATPTNLGVSIQHNPAISEQAIPAEPLPKMTAATPEEVNQRVNDAGTYSWSDKESHQMNLDTLPEGEVGNIMAIFADKNAAMVNDQRRGSIADEALFEMAKVLRADPEFLNKVLKMQPGTALAPEEMLAAKQMLIMSAEDLSTMSKDFGQLNDSAKQELVKRTAIFEQMYGNFMGARAESGRSLRVHQLDSQVGTGQVDVDQMASALQQTSMNITPEGRAFAMAMADDASGISQIIDATRQTPFERTFDTAYEIFINGILSGIKTHIVNFSGSSVRTGVNVFDTAIAGLFGGGAASPADLVARGEWKAQMFGLTTGWNEAFHVSAKVMKTTKKYGDVDKLDSSMQEGFIKAESYDLDPEGVAGKTVDWIGTIIRSPTERLMGGTDAFNKYMAETMSLSGQAYSRAIGMQKEMGLDETATMNVLQQLIENPTVEMRAIAKQDGKMMTFQEDLGPWGKGLQTSIQGNRAAKMVIPFFKTPANLMKQGFLERSPLGLATKQFQDDFKSGGRRRQMALSKMTTGSMISLGLTAMGTQGMINGHYSKDKDVRNAQMAAGWEPMSFVINNDDGSTTYVPFDRVEPFSYLFGMAADLSVLGKEGQVRDLTATEMDQYTKMASALVVAVGENTLSKTFMTGVRSVMDAFTKGGYHAEMWLKNTTNAFTPFSGTRRNLTDFTGEGLRLKSNNISDYWSDQMLIMESESAPLVDVWGRDVSKRHLYIPWDFTESKQNSIQMRVLQMAEVTGQSPIPLPPKKIQGVALSAKQQYTFTKLSRTPEFMEAITETMNEPSWDNIYIDDQVKTLQGITRQFDKAGKGMMVDMDDNLKRKIYNHKNQSAALRIANEEGGDPKSILNRLTDESMGVE